ncbi:MAG TPA: arylsulfatase [Chthoniobacteraceae bacterium]|nr:arylsulfatase [Chthoniobacteraceae bacterium]
MPPSRYLPMVSALLALPFIALADDTRPNVLLIISDDQGYGDLSLHGNPNLHTPNLDRMAREGAQLSRFYVSPVCAPTRAALLTGRYSLRTGAWGVSRGQETMRTEEFTLAEALRAAGWQTGLFGKWHNGEHFPNSPQGQGFGDFVGFTRGHWNNYFNTGLRRGEREEKTQGYLPDVLTGEALAFMDKHRARPFLCMVAYNTPHSPFQVPDAYFERMKAKGLDDELACIYGMCENLDENVGKLLRHLDQLKIAERTIVIFMSDNGPNTLRFNGGMKGKKGGVDEGSVRVPCFVRWPGKITPRIVPNVTAHIDIMPTLLDLCDVMPNLRQPPNALDGVSLAGLLSGDIDAEVQSSIRDRALFVHQVRGAKAQPFPGSVRTQQHRAVNMGKGWQLYDMQADPAQAHDIAKEQSATTQALAAKYDLWWRDVAPAQFELIPIPVGHPNHDRIELPSAEARRMSGVQFSGKHPNNAWFVGWNSLDAYAEWEIDVVRDGIYRVHLEYVAATGGARVRVVCGQASSDAVVTETPFRQLDSPDRVPRDEVHEMEWSRLSAGELQLTKGRHTLRIQALEKTAAEVMQLSAVILARQ